MQNNIIFSFDNNIGNITIRDKKFFVCIIDMVEVRPFLSTLKETAEYLFDLFSNASGDIEFKLNYNKFSTKRKKKTIKRLLATTSEIDLKNIAEWLVLLL